MHLRAASLTLSTLTSEKPLILSRTLDMAALTPCEIPVSKCEQ